MNDFVSNWVPVLSFAINVLLLPAAVFVFRINEKIVRLEITLEQGGSFQRDKIARIEKDTDAAHQRIRALETNLFSRIGALEQALNRGPQSYRMENQT